MGDDGDALLCPFRAATGVPCPLCGGVRAFGLAARGDLGFLSYNGWWVLAAVAFAALHAGIALAPRSRELRSALTQSLWATPRRALLVLATLAAGGWAWALVQQDAIAG